MDLTWYNLLNKPFFTPPSWLFGPAWTILYILIAISGIIIWRKRTKNKKVKNAMQIFFVQLALNLVWSPVFFGIHQIFLALIIIFVLWYFIYRTIIVFGKIDRIARILLYPYLAWVSFALLLNFSVWLLNM